MRFALIAVLACVLAGCDVFGCDTETRIIEVVPGAIDYDLQRIYLQHAEDQGFNCVAEPIRNGSGTQIGTRHTCTKCS